MKIEKNCYHVTLYLLDGQGYWLTFLNFPTYLAILRHLPNDLKKIFAVDKTAIKFDLETLVCEGSSPLFKDDPTAKKRWLTGFPHKENLIGRLIVQKVKLFP